MTSLKITWYGESGFRIESAGRALLIDPYFSDALGLRNPDRHRMVPFEPAWLERNCDALLFTHCHIDHTDPETVKALLKSHPDLVMAGPSSSRALLPFAPVYVEMPEGVCAQIYGFEVRALPAVHSDRFAVGYEIKAEGRTLYFSGDTALLSGLWERVPHGADAAFLCFNAGVGKNMNEDDAVRLAKLTSPRLVIPFHYGLLIPEVTPDRFLNMLDNEGIASLRPEIGRDFEV